jgi:2-deoxy-D-gluconate 3-dehydrogenase
MTIFDLQNRVAFVTGGNGGIGLGMAKGLAAAGAAIVIAGRHKMKAQLALSELRSLGATCRRPVWSSRYPRQQRRDNRSQAT